MSIPSAGRDLMAHISARAALHAGLPPAQRRPFSVTGGSSKAFWGPGNPAAEPLSTAALTGIVAYEPSELVITALGGTPLADVEAALASQGQCLAFDPPRFGWAGVGETGMGKEPTRALVREPTLGGIVSSGLSGPARASVGAVRDFVLGAKLINGQGQWLEFGGQVMKNVAGYDISRLLCGAWGTLGVVAEVSLKVLPNSPADATLAFEMPQQAALDALNRWGGQPLPLNASVWQGSASSGGSSGASPGASSGASPGVLHLRLRGAQAAVHSACAKLGGQRVPEAEAAQLWASWRDQTHPFFAAPSPQHSLWRLSVPQTAPGTAPELAHTHQAVEWHGGQRWVWATAAEAQALTNWAQSVNGSASVFVATNPANTATEAQKPIKNAVQAALQRRIQAEFDPHGVFDATRLFGSANL